MRLDPRFHRRLPVAAGLVLVLVALGAAFGYGRAATAPLWSEQPAAAALNLVENAVKYTPRGGTVEISVVRDGAAVLFVVEDTGPGVPLQDADRVFEPFVRLDTARAGDVGGIGLGLAIARSIAIAHGGTLTVERRAGGGARFVIRLPAVAE